MRRKNPYKNLNNDGLQIFPEIVGPGDNGNDQRNPKKNHPDRMEVYGKIASVEDQKEDGSHFENRLIFPQITRRNNNTLSDGNPS